MDGIADGIISTLMENIIAPLDEITSLVVWISLMLKALST